MKKLVLALGLALILAAWGWQGPSVLGSSPAYGQPPPPPPGYTCDPYNSYQCYYSAPYYEDPADQFLYYVAPEIVGGIVGGEEEHHYRHREPERRGEYHQGGESHRGGEEEHRR